MKSLRAIIGATFVALLFFSFMRLAVTRVVPKNLDESEAVTLAETFVRQNGYTWWPASKDKFTREPLQCPLAGNDQVLESRHNTVTRNAYGLIRHQFSGAPGWTIIFRRKGEGAVGGKAVGMKPDGSGIHMEYGDVRLTIVEKIL